MAILSMLRGLAMLLVRDENNIRGSFSLSSLSNCSSFYFNSFEFECLAGLKLVRYEVKQPQQMGSMADFSAFPFVQQAQQSHSVEIW